jgi:hypothetical protein
LEARIKEIDMPETNVIAQHMEVLGADGVHVGTVDHLDGDDIKLTRAATTTGTTMSRRLWFGTSGETLSRSRSLAQTRWGSIMSEVVTAAADPDDAKQPDQAEGAGEDEGSSSHDGQDGHLKEDQKPTTK